ncbi:MAG: hypothetical protein OQJ81_06555 [Melioribacteraceae bacterium]|nr:hypothetical protein [Melioribacteraceae bacterium]
MKDNYNELVNNYIDKELNPNEIEKVEELVHSNNEFRTILSVHNFVHETLSEIPQKFAPIGITESIMNNIVKKISDKYRKNYLFRGVISVLSMILIFTLFFFFYYLGDLVFVQNVAESTQSYSNIFSTSFSYLSQLVKTDIFRTVSALLGFIVLVGFYFNYNSHKSLKETLDKF